MRKFSTKRVLKKTVSFFLIIAGFALILFRGFGSSHGSGVLSLGSVDLAHADTGGVGGGAINGTQGEPMSGDTAGSGGSAGGADCGGGGGDSGGPGCPAVILTLKS